MMSLFAFGFAFLAVAGAAACWIAGAMFLGRTLDALGDRRRFRWLSLAAWPVAYSRLPSQASDPSATMDTAQFNAAQINAAKVNKALVAFIACLMMAGAATSVATNLHRMAI